MRKGVAAKKKKPRRSRGLGKKPEESASSQRSVRNMNFVGRESATPLQFAGGRALTLAVLMILRGLLEDSDRFRPV
jgi:hypothetical protein